MFTDTDSKLKPKIFMKMLVRIKKCYWPKSKYYDSNNSVVGNMKNDMGGVTIKKSVGLKPKMDSFLVDDSSEHKKAKDANKNVVKRKNPSNTKMFC